MVLPAWPRLTAVLAVPALTLALGCDSSTPPRGDCREDCDDFPDNGPGGGAEPGPSGTSGSATTGTGGAGGTGGSGGGTGTGGSDGATGTGGSGGGSSAGPASVRVSDSGGGSVADIPILLHDAAGAVLAMATTDVEGLATFDDVAPGSMITVGHVPDLTTFAAVEPGDELAIDVGFGPADPHVGDATVTLPAAPPGASFFRVYAGCDYDAGPDASATFTISVSSRCLGSDDAIGVLAVAYDGVADPVAVSYLDGVRMAGDLDVTLGDWTTDFSPFTFSLTDAPLGEVTNFQAEWVNDGVGLWAPTKSGNTNTIFFPVPTGFVEAIDLQMGFVGPGDGASHFYATRVPGGDAGLALPTADAKLPAVVDAMAGGDAVANQRLTWTTDGDTSGADGTIVRTRWFPKGFMVTWAFIVPPDATEVPIPTLEGDLAVLTPTEFVADPYVVLVEGSRFADRAAFRQRGAELVAGPRLSGVTGEVLRGSVYFPAPF